ncbi:RNA polymerase sigma factor [Streptomyces sp. NPDC058301]|uniref:RNA polymerase sigma factor n=1 Tax=Streptomyces sp. NPDC058301 TaxID=3346436 RepID=UPI0036E6E4DB
MTTTNDSQAPVTTALLPRAQAGDDRAMNDILLHIAPFVGRLCLPIAQSHSSDAAQEAMLAIFRGIRGLREPEAFYGWVRAVTVREAVRTSKRLSQGPTDDLTDRAQDGNPLDTVHISDAMDRLPDQHRQVLVLRAVYGMNEEEMAATLALPVGTVRSRLHRARRNFQDAWHQQSA